LTLFSAVLLRHSHAQAIGAARDLTRGAAAALSEPVGRGLRSVDRLLLEIAAQPLSPGKPSIEGAGADPSLVDRIRDFPAVRALLMTDAAGTVVRSSAAGFLGVKLGDREWLTSLERGAPSPLVGEVDVPGAPQLLPVAERLPANAGAVIALVDFRSLAPLLDEFTRRFGVHFNLHRAVVGGESEAATVVPFLTSCDKTQGHAHDIIGSEALPALPVFITATLTRDAALAPFWRELSVIALAFGAAGVSVLLTLFMLYRQVEMLRREHDLFRENQSPPTRRTGPDTSPAGGATTVGGG
jgi:hypothetical protein